MATREVVLVSEKELLETDLTGFATYTSNRKSNKAYIVSQVKYLRNLYRWDDFEQGLNSNMQHLNQEKKFQPLNITRLAKQKISNEIDLHVLVKIVLVDVFEQILENKGMFYSQFKLNIGIADLVYTVNDDDSTLTETDFERVRLIIELKTKWILDKPPDDLIKYYYEKISVGLIDGIVSAVIQLHTYMLRNKRKYGVLTSFDASYFFKLENDTDLFISNIITPRDMLKAFKHILDLSSADGVLNISGATGTDELGNRFSSEDDCTLKENKRKRGERCENRNKKKALEGVNETEIDAVLENGTVLSSNDAHSVKRVLLRNEQVKLKICDVTKRDQSGLENEAYIYKYLNLNKVRMGEFVFAGLISDMFFTLCVKYIDGTTIEFNQMSSKARMNCIKALEKLHSIGIRHDDVRCENFIVDSNQNVYITDFEFSSVTGNKSLLKFEMNGLKAMLFDHDDSSI